MDCRNPAHDPLITENNSEASCSFTRRQSRENPRKRKRMDVLHEEPEPQPEETPGKKRRTETEEKGTQPVRRINLFRMARFHGCYTLKEMLGISAFGYVFAGVRKSDGKKVALKLVPKFENASFMNLPGDTRRLPLEVALLELVCKPPRCPYVIELLEWFETPTFFILVLERPDPCIDLYKYCRVQCNKVSESQAQIIMQQVIQAARHCRDRGVFHRDIKEGHILLNPQTFEVKLIDFSFGALLTDAPYTEYADTVHYIPPEWIFTGGYDTKPATVRALGILLCRLLHAEQPYFGPQQISDGPLDFSDDVSEACRSLINWCMEIDPQKQPRLEQMLAHPWF